MKVAKIINNQIFIDEIENFYPSTSFPIEGITDEILNSFNVYEVIERLPHSNLQKMVIIEPQFKDGKVYTIEVVDKTKEEIDIEKFIEVRRDRNILLNDSDIYVLPDRWELYSEEKKTEWRNYRQTLRDLPKIYENNIHSIVYPQVPS